MRSRGERRRRAAKEARRPGPSEAPPRRRASWLSRLPLLLGPSELSPPRIRDALPHLLIVFVAACSLYAFTTPRTVALEDDGEFITMAYYLGVPHPPGYPLYVLLAKPFTWLPIGSVAYRVHLASAFFGAATCAALWWVARTLVLGVAASYLGALVYAVSRVFWSQAIIAEVYTLNTLVFFVLLAQCLGYVHDRRAWRLDLIALVYGLGLCNHWPLLVVATPCLLLLLLAAGRGLWRDVVARLPRLALMLALGLLPYAWLVLRSRSAPELAFYGAIDTWRDLWAYVTRSRYAWIEKENPPADIRDRLHFLGFLLRESAWQFTPAGALAAIAGFAVQWRRWGPLTSVALLTGFLGSMASLVTLIDGSYDFLTQIVLRVFPMVSYGIMALWIALAFSTAFRYLHARGPGWATSGYVAAAALLAGTLATNLRANQRRNYALARDYAVTLLDGFSPNATVLTAGDADTFALAYFHFVEGLRPDVDLRVVYGVGLGIDGRMFDPLKLTAQQQMDELIAFAERSESPVYFFDNSPQALDDEDYGFYYKVGRSRGGRRTFRVDPALLALFRRIAGDQSETDGMTVVLRGVTNGQIARILTPIVHDDEAARAAYDTDLELASQHFEGMLARVRYLNRARRVDDQQLLALVERAEASWRPTVRRWSHAGLYFVKGHVLTRLGRTREAIDAFERSLAIQPSQKNDARRELAALGVSVP